MSVLTDVPIWIFLISVVAGYLLGVISGLVPGIHTNNFALILLAFSPCLSENGLPVVCIASMILANSISHTFHDIIPSIFLGAPGEDTALAVLPGHTLLLEGQGAQAIRLSALGSAGSVVLSLLTVIPLSFLFVKGYQVIQNNMAYILIFVVLVMVMTEKGEYLRGEGRINVWRNRAFAFLLFGMSGLLGIFAFRMESFSSPIISWAEGSILLPLLSGLFGASQLIISLFSDPVIPMQYDSRPDLERNRILRGIVTGSIFGSIVAWLPGVSSSIATVFARLFVKEGSSSKNVFRDDRALLSSSKEFIVSISGVNTSNAIFGLMALAFIGKTRSGAMVAIDELMGAISLETPIVILFLCVILLTSLLSYLSTIYLGDNIHHVLERINYSRLCYSIIFFLAVMVLLSTGMFGILIFIISIPIGMLAPFLGVKKSHCMGVILLPVIIYFI
ncbi:tripartite tricarboxylate transporter permease [Methanolobus sediminis]|uniref:Tripartite tricarboxylate transporter permease n=1 Tax=Methanolobus sediminis TaxID=3072978 RepID=A0AA51YLU6_9EURY|nr:tripartite tricarboxylate transporter permease [Methanolobus sediminis]WMW24898.1 tripartite tricarboxylate transporter permease [Methanolobus sediminis]